MVFDFKDKIVFIVGGTGSIGGIIGDAFTVRGAIVYRHGLHGEYKADVRKGKAINRVIAGVLREHGRVDILINSVSAPVSIASFERKHWGDFLGHLEIQLKSAVETAGLIIPSMKKEKYGRIIHILTTSIGGKTPSNMSDYITAKYALLGFTKALAKDVGKYNITVNALSPSFIGSNLTSHFPDKLKDFIIFDTPISRLVKPNEIAQSVLFLASDDASYITGENIQVSGGNNL